jgi:hypothetical protein
MRILLVATAAVVGSLLVASREAVAETCSARAAACVPHLVDGGAQWGGTIEGFRTSCAERRTQCLRSGVWVHMGAARRGEREDVARR